MFRIDVINLLGENESHYWMNKKDDDFLQFLPKHFGVPKENISVSIMGNDDDDSLITAYLNSHDLNEQAFSSDNEIHVNRVFKGMFNDNDPLTPDDYEQQKLNYIDAMKGTTNAASRLPDMPTVSKPTGEKDPDTNQPIFEDVVILPPGHKLITGETVNVKKFVGVPMSKWPYDENGKFLGNK